MNRQITHINYEDLYFLNDRPITMTCGEIEPILLNNT